MSDETNDINRMGGEGTEPSSPDKYDAQYTTAEQPDTAQAETGEETDEDDSDVTAEAAAMEESAEAEDVLSEDVPSEEEPAEEEPVYYDDDDDEERPSALRRFMSAGRPAIIVILALAALLGLSLVPWSSLTGGFIKDFDLLADIKPRSEADTIAEATDMIDPALVREMEMLNSGHVAPQLTTDTMPAITGADGSLSNNPPLDTLPEPTMASRALRVGDLVVLEDYSPDGNGLKHLRSAMANRNQRPARIAMIGDSYIEGDIVTMELRNLLQQNYGGRGVGYVAAHNIVQGFRTSVRHSDSGWTQHASSEISGTNYMPLAGEYYTGGSGTSISLSGVDKSSNLKAWNSTRVMFIAPSGGTITITADNTDHTYTIEGAPGVQSVVLPGETSSVKIKSAIPGLKLFGVWVEDGNGVVVDNMSVRGDSGISRKYVNVSLSRQMGQWIDYDLIIVEYGINALTAKQTNYTKYSDIMVDVLQRLKQCYPNADIILMGIGDRGQKIHGEPHSLPTAPAMVEAQRRAAKKAGVMFWDTREAMGGEDAIVRWRAEKLANADYIHLNHEGGKRLGTLLFNAIDHALKNNPALSAPTSTNQ